MIPETGASDRSTECRDGPIVPRGAQSLAVSLQLIPQACTATAVSGTIFTHYVEHTSGLLAAVPRSESPFLTVVLPLARGDETLMHCVLAMSGTHLAFPSLIPSAGLNSTGADIFELAAISHQLQRMNTSETREKIKVLLLPVMLSQFEVQSVGSVNR